jgi:hypothetical protein
MFAGQDWHKTVKQLNLLIRPEPTSDIFTFMKSSQPWITEVKYYKNGVNDDMVYVYSDGSWQDQYGFGIWACKNN